MYRERRQIGCGGCLVIILAIIGLLSLLSPADSGQGERSQHSWSQP